MHLPRIRRKRSEIPIVPMIDILFILLVYLVVTTEARKPRQIMRIELPTVREVPSETTTETRSVIAIDALGNVTLDGTLAVPEGLLDMYLTAFQNENPGRRLELEADRQLPLERLLYVWDALVRSGIEIKDVPARIKLPAPSE